MLFRGLTVELTGKPGALHAIDAQSWTAGVFRLSEGLGIADGGIYARDVVCLPVHWAVLGMEFVPADWR